eukprot:scaffold297170_cov47-Prasinocladus_malaysianus.AAC.1
MACKWQTGSCHPDPTCAACQTCMAELEATVGLLTPIDAWPSGELLPPGAQKLNTACLEMGLPGCATLDWTSWYHGT